jgi:hypothetical protein
MKQLIIMLLKSVLQLINIVEGVGTGVLKSRINWAIAKLSN